MLPKIIEITNDVYAVPLGSSELVKIKAKALRRGVWFRVLTRAERAQIELTMKIVKKIRSFILAKVVTCIVKKLLDAMESKVAQLMREVGQALAQKLSRTAQKWGNKTAPYWETDSSFIQYLTVTHLNTSTTFKS
jgi:hypothetical protein